MSDERRFTVQADNLVVGAQGSTLSEADLEGVNVDALVAGGHLVEIDGGGNPVEPPAPVTIPTEPAPPSEPEQGETE